jgi:hypothetical protein
LSDFGSSVPMILEAFTAFFLVAFFLATFFVAFLVAFYFVAFFLVPAALAAISNALPSNKSDFVKLDSKLQFQKVGVQGTEPIHPFSFR